jgi:hypothetical protein
MVVDVLAVSVSDTESMLKIQKRNWHERGMPYLMLVDPKICFTASFGMAIKKIWNSIVDIFNVDQQKMFC